MAWTGSFLCNQAKLDFMKGLHDAADTYKIALYDANAAFTATGTVEYSATNEITGTGYVAGGATLAGLSQALVDGVAVWDFTDPSWTGATFTAYGALIYNDTNSPKGAIAVIDFGGPKVVTAGTFTYVLPAATATEGLIRIQ